MNSRKDSFTSMIVDYGAQIAEGGHVKTGARYMAHWGVPLSVALRVLVLNVRRK